MNTKNFPRQSTAAAWIYAKGDQRIALCITVGRDETTLTLKNRNGEDAPLGTFDGFTSASVARTEHGRAFERDHWRAV